MTYTIELKKEKIARLSNKEPFILPEILELEFLSTYDLSNAYITLKNGENKATYKITKPFTVDNKFLQAGKLYLSICLYVDGVAAKTWEVAPIKIFEAKGKVYAFDELTRLESRVEYLENTTVSKADYLTLLEKVNELITAQNKTAETIKEIKEN